MHFAGAEYRRPCVLWNFNVFAEAAAEPPMTPAPGDDSKWGE